MPDDRLRSTVESYNAVADDYVKRNAETPERVASFLRELMVRLAPGRRRIADLGCGPGRDAASIAGFGHDVVGVDLSEVMLGKARAEGVSVTCGDLRSPPLRAASLDAIWSCAALLHVPAEDLSRTLGAWAYALDTQGWLALSTSLGSDEGWELTPYAPSTQPGDGELRRWFVHYGRDQLLREVERADFRVVSVAESESHRRWIHILGTKL